MAQPQEQASGSKSMYDVGAFTIFYKNFITGLARSLGSVVIWCLFLFLLAQVFTQVIWPKLEKPYQQYLKTIESITQLSQPTVSLDQQSLQQTLNQLFAPQAPTASPIQ